MKNKFYLFFAFIIVGLSLFLRLYKIENRAPFDWDQNRDYLAISGIVRGKATLIGPVAKGEGGFFLGPLYYYLVVPAYKLMHGSPLSLPVTSVIIDVLAVVTILALFRTIIGDTQTLALASLWSTSWFVIEMSRISWNVALVPLWSVLLLYFLSHKTPLSIFKVGLLGVLVGFSWHVHAALIPISLAILIFNWKIWALDYKKILALIIGYGLPLVPLVLFDLRHSGLNYHLFIETFTSASHTSVVYSKLIEAIMLRFGKNTQSLLLGITSYNLILGYLMTLIALIGVFFGRSIYRLSGLIIILNLLAVFALREIGFPEYYLAVSYIPSLLLLIGGVSYLTKHNHGILVFTALVLLFLNSQKYTFAETTFSLSRKISVAEAIVSLNIPVDLRFAMAPGREGGIAAFYTLFGGKLDQSSHLKVIVTDQSDGPILESGELTTIFGNYGGIRLAKIVVE